MQDILKLFRMFYNCDVLDEEEVKYEGKEPICLVIYLYVCL